MTNKSLLRSSLVNNRWYETMLVGNSAFIPVATGYELLETTILNSSQDSVTFSNINTNYGSTYKHIQIRIVSRNNIATAWNRLEMNPGSGITHRAHYLFGNGSSASSNTISTSVYYYCVMGTNEGSVIIDILDAFSTSKNKTFRTLGGVSNSADGIFLSSGLPISTAALNGLQFTLDGGNSFVAGSRFSLYGLRSA